MSEAEAARERALGEAERACVVAQYAARDEYRQAAIPEWLVFDQAVAAARDARNAALEPFRAALEGKMVRLAAVREEAIAQAVAGYQAAQKQADAIPDKMGANVRATGE